VDPSLGLFLAIMGSICVGLAVSLWLAVRVTKSSYKTPDLVTYICLDCGYRVSVPQGEQALDQLRAVSNLHWEVSHGRE
jgi:hypothetical protein